MEKIRSPSSTVRRRHLEGLNALKDLHRQGDITVYASTVIAKDAAGVPSVREAADRGPVGTLVGVVGGSLVGLLGGPVGVAVGAYIGGVGGLAYDLFNTGVSYDLVDNVSTTLTPGKTAIVADIDEDADHAGRHSSRRPRRYDLPARARRMGGRPTVRRGAGRQAGSSSSSGPNCASQPPHQRPRWRRQSTPGPASWTLLTTASTRRSTSSKRNSTRSSRRWTRSGRRPPSSSASASPRGKRSQGRFRGPPGEAWAGPELVHP